MGFTSCYFSVLVNIIFKGCILLRHADGSSTLENTYFLNSWSANFQAEKRWLRAWSATKFVQPEPEWIESSAGTAMLCISGKEIGGLCFSDLTQAVKHMPYLTSKKCLVGKMRCKTFCRKLYRTIHMQTWFWFWCWVFLDLGWHVCFPEIIRKVQCTSWEQTLFCYNCSSSQHHG